MCLRNVEPQRMGVAQQTQGFTHTAAPGVILLIVYKPLLIIIEGWIHCLQLLMNTTVLLSQKVMVSVMVRVPQATPYSARACHS